MALPTPLADTMQARSRALSEYKHDNPAAAHRVHFIDISDLEGKPKQRIIVGYGCSKDHKRTNQQTDGIRKAMIAVSSWRQSKEARSGHLIHQCSYDSWTVTTPHIKLNINLNDWR